MKSTSSKPAHLIWGALIVLLLLRAIFPDFFRGLGDGLFDGLSGH